MRLPTESDDAGNRPVAPEAEESDERTRVGVPGALDAFNAADYSGSSRPTASRNGALEDYMDNAYFWMGECHYGLGQYDQAITYFSAS